MENILNKLWAYQESKGITCMELAQELKVHQVYISRWKKGNISKMSLRVVEQFLKDK